MGEAWPAEKNRRGMLAGAEPTPLGCFPRKVCTVQGGKKDVASLVKARLIESLGHECGFCPAPSSLVHCSLPSTRHLLAGQRRSWPWVRQPVQVHIGSSAVIWCDLTRNPQTSILFPFCR